MTGTNSSAVGSRITFMEQRAGAPFTSKLLGGTTTECDLVARLVKSGTPTGYLFQPSAGNFVASDGTTTISDSALRALATTAGQEVTFTCVLPGSGSCVAFSQ